MKFSATVDDRNFELELTNRDQARIARVGKKRYGVDVEQLGPHHLLVRLDGRVFDVLVAGNGRERELLINGKPCRVRVEDARLQQLRRLSGQEAESDGPVNITAPMPGLVLKLLVKEGETVERRSGLAIIEAMKMENEIRAERSGTVRKIFVQEGQAVEKGQPLLEID